MSNTEQNELRVNDLLLEGGEESRAVGDALWLDICNVPVCISTDAVVYLMRIMNWRVRIHKLGRVMEFIVYTEYGVELF